MFKKFSSAHKIDQTTDKISFEPMAKAKSGQVAANLESVIEATPAKPNMVTRSASKEKKVVSQ